MEKLPANLRENFGNVYGSCVRLLKETDEGNKIYEIKPYIRGKFGMPIRVLTRLTLRTNYFYSILGYLDTIVIDSLTVPVLVVSRITRLTRLNNINKPYTRKLYTTKETSRDRAKFASFCYLENLTVVDINREFGEYIVRLKKEIESPKYLNVLDLVSLTTTYSRNQFDSINIGDKISVIGSIHRDRKYDNKTVGYEIGFKILDVNPSEYEINKLKISLEILHMQNIGDLNFDKLLEKILEDYSVK